MVNRVQLDFRLQLTFLLVAGLGLLEARVLDVIPELDQNFVKDFELENYDGLKANIDKIFDDLLPMVKDEIIKHGLDPARLQDVHKDLPGILGTDGVLHLSNGWMQGFSAVQRSGDAILSYENKVMTLDAMVGIDVIDIAFDYSFKYSIISRSGPMRIRLSDTKMRLILKVNLEQYRISLESFQVTSVSKMKVTIEGNVVDKILTAAINAFIRSLKPTIIEIVESQGSHLVRKLLTKINEKLPRPDGVRSMSLEDDATFHKSNVLAKSEMLNNIPIFIEFVVV